MAEHQLGLQVPMRLERGLQPCREWNLAFPPTLGRANVAAKRLCRSVRGVLSTKLNGARDACPSCANQRPRILHAATRALGEAYREASFPPCYGRLTEYPMPR